MVAVIDWKQVEETLFQHAKAIVRRIEEEHTHESISFFAFYAEPIQGLFDLRCLSFHELQKASETFGLLIPTASQEWYMLARRREDLNGSQNYLLPPFALKAVETFVIFFEENQATCAWAIRVQDSENPDQHKCMI